MASRKEEEGADGRNAMHFPLLPLIVVIFTKRKFYSEAWYLTHPAHPPRLQRKLSFLSLFQREPFPLLQKLTRGRKRGGVEWLPTALKLINRISQSNWSYKDQRESVPSKTGSLGLIFIRDFRAFWFTFEF